MLAEDPKAKRLRIKGCRCLRLMEEINDLGRMSS